MQTLVEAPMKRSFSAIILVALATICSAQTTESFTTYLTLKQSGLSESTWNTNWSAGFLVPLYTAEKWSVQAGLEYQRLVMEGPVSFSIPAIYGLAQTESDPGHGLMLYVQSTFRYAAGTGYFLLPLSAGVQYQRTGEIRMMAVDVSRTPYDPTLFVRVGTRRSTDVYDLHWLPVWGISIRLPIGLGFRQVCVSPCYNRFRSYQVTPQKCQPDR